jgi:hypothetical protein
MSDPTSEPDVEALLSELRTISSHTRGCHPRERCHGCKRMSEVVTRWLSSRSQPEAGPAGSEHPGWCSAALAKATELGARVKALEEALRAVHLPHPPAPGGCSACALLLERTTRAGK